MATTERLYTVMCETAAELRSYAGQYHIHPFFYEMRLTSFKRLITKYKQAKASQ